MSLYDSTDTVNTDDTFYSNFDDKTILTLNEEKMVNELPTILGNILTKINPFSLLYDAVLGSYYRIPVAETNGYIYLGKCDYEAFCDDFYRMQTKKRRSVNKLMKIVLREPIEDKRESVYMYVKIIIDDNLE